tara:strand:+ start:3265 stop:3486 length:222 start_codon:yes stop_codon:yes gene_type:complete
MSGIETGAITLGIIGAISGSIMAFIKMLSDRNAVVDCKCCKLDLRSKEVRLAEIEACNKNCDCSSNNKNRVNI